MKVKQITFCLCIISFLFSCNSNIGVIKAHQIHSDLPVILRLSKKHKTIGRIRFPVKFQLKNESSKDKSFTSFSYYYYLTDRKKLGKLYLVENDRLIAQNRQKKNVLGKGKNEYVFYTSHTLDTLQSTREYWDTDIKKMLISNKDSTIYGSISDFKTKNSVILNELTKKDTIILKFLEEDSKTKTWKEIKIPIKF